MHDHTVLPGDIYQLGRHRLMCGDATNKADVAALFGHDKPTLVVTSPPYAKQRDYDRPIACWDSMMLGALDGHAFADDAQLLINLGAVHQKNEIVLYWHQWVQSMRAKAWRFHALYPWDKTLPLPGYFGARLLPSHEFVLHLNKKSIDANKWVPCAYFNQVRSAIDIACKKGERRQRNKAQIASHRVPYSVIRIRPVRGKTGESANHPAQMPVALAQFLIKSWVKIDCITYDPFCGSGTTLHAAQQEGVIGLGMEIAPAYVQIALDRWNKAYPDQSAINLTRPGAQPQPPAQPRQIVFAQP